MTTLFIDTETYSARDIKRGGLAYAKDETTQLLCLAWAFDKEDPSLWTVAGGDLPERVLEHISSSQPVCAFNATFDYRIWNCVGVRDFGWPALSLEQIIDAQALCACYQIPQNLKDAGAALRLTQQKDKAGINLIKACCQPDKDGNAPYNPVAFNELTRYCQQDVRTLQQIVYALPRQALIPQEQQIWEFTYHCNATGLPVDLPAVVAVYEYLQKYIEKTVVELPKLTDGQVTTPGQIARIVAWCAKQGYYLPNLQADTVEQELAKPSLPAKIRRVLELRQELGRSSTAKYKKILEQAVLTSDGARVYDNLRYHGAGTGRWTGQGFQMHNLPRASITDKLDPATTDPAALTPDYWISKFHAGEEIDDPVFMAKALIRPMIQAPKGYKIIVADYASIENRILAWAAGDTGTLLDFENGVDQYKTMASARFGVPYDQVTKEQRRVGKVIILGAGYGMGAKKFQATALLQAGLELTPEEAQASVTAYRERYPQIKALWNNLRRVAAEAVISGQRRKYKDVLFGTFNANGHRWLAMRLPTGKSLYYADPSVREELIKDYEYMGPVPTITHYGTDPYTKKWSRLKLIPGRITENLVQATAREVMAYGMLNAQKKMPYLQFLGSVHDEALALIPDDEVTDENLELFMHSLCGVDFLPGCPIKAEGFYCERYKKG